MNLISKKFKIATYISLFYLLLSQTVYAQLSIEQAHIRLLPPVVKNTAAFFNITNTSEQDIHLVSAHSNISELVEFHTHVMKGNIMSMVQLPKLVIPAKETITLNSGGIHLMFLNLHSPLKAKQAVQFELIDNAGKRYSFTANVKAENSHSHHHH
ncbi:copper chaperone PCu(A)C [Algibacillus agarilyticus]|uniref:copper chaperone PCu(A)C n=1 Tax=Algibacillus agarilyticus TaxID=2234133 RepID=UPI000DD0CB27|nr:copper chaperone PCu(A)C [Algibacillus agarilyticus]